MTDKKLAIVAGSRAKVMKTKDIAQVYWQLAHQPTSAWTHEVDLRPQSENF